MRLNGKRIMAKKNKKKNRNRKAIKKSGGLSEVTKNDGKDKNPSISVCMIVKDEERFLDNCLQSVIDIADEIIIIDTGSQDNTGDIAKKYTDKVYFHAWNDSFSEARNHYFDYATGDWIFQIDADEELIKEDIPTLMKAVKNPDIDAVMVQIVSSFRQGENEGRHNVERIFRNNGIIHYEGRVHNRLVGLKKPRIYPIRLMHYGYDLKDNELSEKKHQRRITLLKKDIEEEPGNPLPYHYLSCCYLPRGLFRETLDLCLKAIELAEKTNNKNPVFLWTRYNAAMAYYKIKDLKNAESMALSASSIDDRHLDSHYILTLIYFDQANWHKVIKHGNKYVRLCKQIKKNPEEFGIIVANSLNESWNILVLTGIAYHENGSLRDSEESFRSAVSSAGNLFLASRAIGIYYYNKGLLSESRKYLKKALDAEKENPTIRELLDKIGSKDNSKPTISCCMIVKNEERFLEKCLMSVKDYVDEIVIVDTGSTDNTVDIARRFTDKIYFHPWENSFSKARNQALGYATGDWIFQIDGDEELMEGSGERLLKAVRDAEDEDIIYVSIFCSYANGRKKSLHNFERLFRNNGLIHYEGSVHNQVVGGSKASFSPIELWHYGYDVDEKKAQEKFNRTTELLKKEIARDPENPKYHHYLSASYFSRGMNEDAVSEAVRAVELSDVQEDNHDLYAWSHFIASMALYRLNKLEEAERYAVKSLKKYPRHMDAYYMLTIISADEKRWDDVIKHGKHFLELLEDIKTNNKEKIILENTMNEGPGVNILVGHACCAKNLSAEMESYYKKAHEISDDKWMAWWNIGVYHMDKSGNLKLAERFLDLAAKEAPHEHDVWYMLAKLNKKLGSNNDEIECLEKVIRIGTTDSFIFERLLSLYLTESVSDKAMTLIRNYGDKFSVSGATLCELAVRFFQNGIMESAIQCYMMALERDPDLFEAWASLGEIMLAMNKRADAKMFFEKAITIRDDAKIILNLCDIASMEGDILSLVNYCELLLKIFRLPHTRTLNNLEDLKDIIIEIGPLMKDHGFHKNQLTSIFNRLSLLQNEHVQTC